MDTVGNFLRAARTNRQWTLGGLATKAGVDKATLSRWESGRTLPRIPELERVLAALNASAGERERVLRRFDAPRALQAIRSPAAPASQSSFMSLGDMLYAPRTRGGWSQRAAGLLVGVSRSLYRLWESDDSIPSNEQLQYACFQMHASADETAVITTRRFAQASTYRGRNIQGGQRGVVPFAFKAYFGRTGQTKANNA